MRLPQRIFAKYWVLGLSTIILIVPVYILERWVLKQTNGTFSYPVDDTFIHMAIAKNLAFHNVWGITPYQFVSASSSLLYPVIIAILLKIFGLHLIIPFLVNIVAAIFLLVVIQQWLIKNGLRPFGQFIILVSVIALVPLPVLVMLGMEHILQLLFFFLFFASFSENLQKMEGDLEKSATLPWQVYFYGAIMMAIRYEALFVIAMAALILLIRRKLYLAFQLGFLCLLPILLFGIYAQYKGNYFMPNSVLLKSGVPPLNLPSLIYYFSEGIFFRLSYSMVGYNMIAAQRLALILPFTYLLFYYYIKDYSQFRYFFVLLITVVCAQLAFGLTLRFPRYEAYLIGLSTVFAGTIWLKYGKFMLKGKMKGVGWVIFAVSLLFIIPVIYRSRYAFENIGRSCVNIYEQQYQMGSFLHDYYNSEKVAINDIGAVSYLTEGQNLDLLGLGNIDAARSIKGKYYSPDFLNWLCKQDSIKIAIIYNETFEPKLYQQWSRIASWQIPNNVICGFDRVFFYAIDPAEKPGLLNNLKQYQSSLPSEVIVQYY